MCWFSFFPHSLFIPSSDVPALKISMLSLSHGLSSADPPSISKSRKSSLQNCKDYHYSFQCKCIIQLCDLNTLHLISSTLSYLIWQIVSSTTGMLKRHKDGLSPDWGYSSFWKYTISSGLLLCWLQLYSTGTFRCVFNYYLKYDAIDVIGRIHLIWILISKDILLT